MGVTGGGRDTAEGDVSGSGVSVSIIRIGGDCSDAAGWPVVGGSRMTVV